MLSLLYFDTEDFVSPPDAPVHRLPGQFADILHRHGLAGCFHIHGMKARFMERHGQGDVIEAIRRHDVSLHFDRGSIHPTTAEEVSGLDWFRGVDRVLFRELPGFQTIERVFGRCSALTQHGGTFAPQIVYAAGRMGKPFFYSPFRLALPEPWGERGVVWYANNLLIAGYQAPFYFDHVYRDTPAFDETLAKVGAYLAEEVGRVDFVPLFGCHPLITILDTFPCVANFQGGATPPPSQWQAPRPLPDASVEVVLANFERLVRTLVAQPSVEWTTVAGIAELYGRRPVRVADRAVVDGARAVYDHGGPTFTPLVSAGELLYLLARRRLRPEAAWDVPQVMGPTDAAEGGGDVTGDVDLERVAGEIVAAVDSSGYLPAVLSDAAGSLSPEAALVRLAADALDRPVPATVQPLEAMPGMDRALDRVAGYARWRVHGPQFQAEAVRRHVVLQAWTLKPAFRREAYARFGDRVELGRHVNPMLPWG